MTLFPHPSPTTPARHTVRASSHAAAESYESFNQRYADFFAGAQDLFEVQRGLNNCFAYDLVPSQQGKSTESSVEWNGTRGGADWAGVCVGGRGGERAGGDGVIRIGRDQQRGTGVARVGSRKGVQWRECLGWRSVEAGRATSRVAAGRGGSGVRRQPRSTPLPLSSASLAHRRKPQLKPGGRCTSLRSPRLTATTTHSLPCPKKRSSLTPLPRSLSVAVVEEALKAARRVNDYSTAVRIFEGLKEKTENAAQYAQYVAETAPLRQELGVVLKEELYSA